MFRGIYYNKKWGSQAQTHDEILSSVKSKVIYTVYKL